MQEPQEPNVEPIWIDEIDAMAIHQRQIAEHGGGDGTRDAGLLAAALDRPKNLLAYGEPVPDIAALAAAYGFGIAKNHPFVDGNKRTALVVCRTFLLINNWNLVTTQEDKYRTFLAVAAGKLSEGALAEWVRSRLQSRPFP